MEIWKTIKGYEDYQISSFGRVKSFKNNKEKIKNPTIDVYGYYLINLCNNGIQKTFKIHKLVATAFLNHKPCGYKLVVNHKDLNKLNNNIDNLEIVTARENTNKKHIKSSSKYVGVSWNKRKNKWVSQIYVDGKIKYLGSFKNEYDAHIAYENELKQKTHLNRWV